ncbi:MAG: serine hydrolase [Terrimicrobiaceae bacterium]
MAITLTDVRDAWRSLYGNTNNNPDASGYADATGYAMQGLWKTGVPGMAIAVVFQNEWRIAFCGSSNEVHQTPINAATVFPIASLSKPITSTIIAWLFTQHRLEKGWDTPIAELDPDYRAPEGVTFSSLLAHRSGLIDHAGDLLEDLGFVRNDIMRHITHLPTWPRDPNASKYACTYQYTNFGFSEAAFALAKAMGNAQWEDLAEKFFEFYDMNRSSYRYRDFIIRQNTAKPYQRLPAPRADRDALPHSPSWVEPATLRNPDAQSPAGGVTSSLSDLIQWMWLNIRAQRAATQAVEMKAHESAELYANIRQTHVAYPDAKDPAHYGFGWNTKIDPDMGFTLSHSGGFGLGAATCVSLLPNENVGIIALTNGQPIGLPEAICHQFLHDVTNDPAKTPFADTLKGAAKFMQENIYPVPSPDFSLPPTKPVIPIKNPSQIGGTYYNDYYQNVTISGRGSSEDPFLMRAGGGRETFVLTPYQELTFTFQTTGENADGLSGVTFTTDPSGKATQLSVNHFKLPVRNGVGGLVMEPGVFKRNLVVNRVI